MKTLKITKEEFDILREYARSSYIKLIRAESKAILMQVEGLKVESISKIEDRTIKTVYEWIRDFKMHQN